VEIINSIIHGLFTVVIILLIISSSLTHADTREELTLIIQANSQSDKKENNTNSFSFRETSEIKIMGMGIIRLYQNIISSQDVPTCNFTLSCSHFGLKAVKQYGFFHGVLMTADRLQRCNGLTRRHYSFDSQSGLAIDYPLEKYYIGTYLNTTKVNDSSVKTKKY